MSTRLTRRLTRQESQAQTRRRLLDAARVVFRAQGFHRASADAIATEAGFTRGALYANFDGKEGLFLALLDEEIDARYAALSAAADEEELATRYCQLLDGDRGWTLALLEFTIHAARNPELGDELRSRNEALRKQTVELIASLRPGFSSERAGVAAKLLLAVNSGVAIERALDRDAAGAAELTLAYMAALEA
jgi:AcrR family transcriptional regulator